MKDLFNALKHCYCEEGNCNGCPYEQELSKCNKLFTNIEMLFNKISEFIDFDDIKYITEIIIKKGESSKNERKN